MAAAADRDFDSDRPHDRQAGDLGRPRLTGLDMEELILRWLAVRPGETTIVLSIRLPFGTDRGRPLLIPTIRALEREGRLVVVGRIKAGPLAGLSCRWATPPDEIARLAGYEPNWRIRAWWPAPLTFERFAGIQLPPCPGPGTGRTDRCRTAVRRRKGR